MITTQATNNIGMPDNAFALVSLLSESAKHQVSQLLNELSKELGGSVWVMPNNALHVTLCEIIQAKDYSEDKQELYDRHSSEYENITYEILTTFKPIDVTFDTIEVSPQAIIIKGTDDGSFEKIRKELVDRLPLPSETKMPPNIIHCSIGRFTKKVPLNQVETIVGRHTINI